jgi:hypothetical protein
VGLCPACRMLAQVRGHKDSYFLTRGHPFPVCKEHPTNSMSPGWLRSEGSRPAPQGKLRHSLAWGN